MRNMTPEEMENKSICVNCAYCVKQYEDRLCGEKIDVHYCRMHLPDSVYDYVRGKATDGFPDWCKCTEHNADGTCPSFLSVSK